MFLFSFTKKPVNKTVNDSHNVCSHSKIKNLKICRCGYAILHKKTDLLYFAGYNALPYIMRAHVFARIILRIVIPIYNAHSYFPSKIREKCTSYMTKYSKKCKAKFAGF